MEPSDKIDWIQVLEFTIPALIAILGWFVGSWLSMRRERLADQRAKRYEFLEKVYFKISELRSVDNLELEELSELWTEIASSIELHGTKQQIETFRRVADEMVPTYGKTVVNPQSQIIKSEALEELLEDIRDEIRLYLEYERVSGEIPFLSHYRES